MRAMLPLGLTVMITVLTGCAESPTGGTGPVVPVASLPALGVMRGTVDLDRGTMEFSPIAPAGLQGFSPALYGDQNVSVRLYNSPVVLDDSGSTWRWTASVGIRNLRSHYIGDEESTLDPVDTMGVFVFFVQDAVPSQPCPGCFARIANHDGIMAFDAPNQKFFYWRERLNPSGSALGDTTRARRTWQFETSAGVRSFTFNVLIAAAWPAPYETRWKVQYTGDTLPATSAPVWKTESWAPGGTMSTAAGSLVLRGNPGGLLMFYRRDPIVPAQSAYMNATARLVSGGTSRPEIAMLLSDHVKLLALGVSSNTVGLMTNAGLFQSGTTSALASGTHQFQLRKYAADSVVWFVDGARRGRALYSALSNDTFTTSPGAYAAFGALPTSGGNNSTWDDVIYEIGAVSP